MFETLSVSSGKCWLALDGIGGAKPSGRAFRMSASIQLRAMDWTCPENLYWHYSAYAEFLGMARKRSQSFAESTKSSVANC